MEKGWLSEIFDSIQGEGIYAGVRQIFIRFSGCNLRCDYCDTPDSIFRRKYCKLQNADFRLQNKVKNPLSAGDITKKIKKMFLSNGIDIYHSVSLTGGEPLLQVDFLKLLIPRLRNPGLKIYLETNGTLPDALREIIGDVDFVAMDVKLPTATGQELWEEHREFLEIGDGKMKKTGCAPIFVKVVITSKTTEEEIKKASRLIAEVNKNIPLILQPVSYRDSCFPMKSEFGQSLFLYQQIANKFLEDIRIIPQLHKIIDFP